MHEPGVVEKHYHHQRQKRIDYIYRLNRRTDEVKRVIKKNFSNYSDLNCLDIGTADGLMLSKLNKIFNFNQAIGIDMSQDLIDTNKDPNIQLKLGDAANLEFANNSFHVIIIISAIDHLEDPHKVLKECFRALKDDGIVILTVANPWHDNMSEMFGYTPSEEHNEKFTLKKLEAILRDSNFKVVKSKYFMLFPFFKIPFEKQYENFLSRIGLGKIMCNQLIVGKKF